jgi:hypothetical protein
VTRASARDYKGRDIETSASDRLVLRAQDPFGVFICQARLGAVAAGGEGGGAASVILIDRSICCASPDRGRRPVESKLTDKPDLFSTRSSMSRAREPFL